MFDIEVFNGHVIDNMAESFNMAMSLASLPIMSLLKKIRLMVIFRFHNRLLKVQNLDTTTAPYVRILLDKSTEKGRNLRMFYASNDEYQVFKGPKRFSVNAPFMHGLFLAFYANV